MKKNILVIFVVFALLGLTIYQYTSDSKEEVMATNEEAPKIGFFAPSLSLKNMEGDQTIAIGGERQKPLMINFWASWCGPCELEAPDLVNLYEKYGDQFDLYAVNSTTFDSVRDAEAFVEKYGFDFPVLMDAEGAAVEKYNVYGYPTSFLVDERGVVVDVILGVLPAKELEKKIKKLF